MTPFLKSAVASFACVLGYFYVIFLPITSKLYDTPEQFIFYSVIGVGPLLFFIVPPVLGIISYVLFSGKFHNIYPSLWFLSLYYFILFYISMMISFALVQEFVKNESLTMLTMPEIVARLVQGTLITMMLYVITPSKGYKVTSSE